MKRLSLLVCTFILVVSGAQAQTQPEPKPWKTYTAKGETFSVALPAWPDLNITKTRFDPKKERQELALGSYADGVVYIVYSVENRESRQSLESFIEQHLAPNSASYLAAERNPSVNGVNGKAFLFSDREGMFQFFATENRLYFFRAFGAPLEDPRMTKFFSSLSFSRKNDDIEVSDGPRPIDDTVTEVDPSVADETPYTGKQTDKKVRIGMKPEPSYTEDAKRNAVTGTVVLRCVFASNGTITRISVMSGLPFGLTERAIAAARKIKFIPAVKDGKFVAMWMQLEYNFNLF